MISRAEAQSLLADGNVAEWNRRVANGDVAEQLDRIDLRGAKLSGVNLTGVHLRGARLDGAELAGARLVCADLTLACLEGANLSEAKLDHCRITSASFSSANLAGANIESAVYDKGVAPTLPRPSAPSPFEKLKLFQDYEKWHVGLYAGGIATTMLATAISKEPGWGLVMLIPAVFFIAAAAFAGTLLGNLSRFDSEAELDASQMEIFGTRTWGKGQTFRVLEKVAFWIGVGTLLAAVILMNLRPLLPAPSSRCCDAQRSSEFFKLDVA